MQRWLILAALAFMVGILPVQGQTSRTSLLEMVPKDIDGCVWLDLSQLLAQPMIAEQIEKQKDKGELRHFRELFARHDLDLFKSFTSMVVFGKSNGKGAMLLETTVPEDRFRTMFEEENPLVAVEQVDGLTVYPMGANGSGKKASAMYVRKDVMLSAANPDDLRTYQDAIKTGGTFAANSALSGYQRRVGPTAAAWAVFINPQADQPVNPQQQPQPNQLFGMIKGGSLAVHIGASPGNAAVDEVNPLQKDDLRLVLRLACKDAQGAAFGALSMNGMLMVGIGQAFAGDPELGTEMSKLLQLRPQQQDIVLDATFTNDLIARLKAAIEKRTQSTDGGLSAGGQPPAPGGGDAPPAQESPAPSGGDNDLLPLPPAAAE
jgi:hypothetical protein